MPHRSPYKTLPTRTSIRLLEIQPATAEASPVRCKFHLVDLEDGPEYEALSYVWGTEGRISPIICDGVEVLVTPNLVAALRHFRTRSACPEPGFGARIKRRMKSIGKRAESANFELGKENRWGRLDGGQPHSLCGFSWADAVCINQEDEKERSQQIGIMGHIFFQAKTVLAWLGPCDNSVRLQKALSLLNRVWREYEREKEEALTQDERQLEVDDLTFYDIKPETFDVKKNQAQGFPKVESDDWEALRWFCDIPWFSRLWILQEMALSQSAVAFMGEYEIGSLYRLGWAATWLLRKQYDLPRPGGVGLRPENISSMLNETLNINIRGGRPRLLTLIARTEKFSCTLPQDRIYALLGVASENNHEAVNFDLITDYSQPFPEVYRRTARIIIECSADLDVLNGIYAPLARPRAFWSSWVPDWSTFPKGYIQLVRVNRDDFDASAGAIREIERSPDERVLRLKGFEVDLVRCCSDPFDDKHHLTWRWDLLAPMVGSCAASYESREKFGQAFTMTMTAASNGFGRSSESSPNFFTEASEWWERLFGEDIILGSREPKRNQGHTSSAMLTPFEQGLQVACRNRRFFATHSGYIGLGPKEMKPFDKVVILFGGRTPYILRPTNYWWIGGAKRPMGRGRDDGNHFLVGECYVHGMMKGEMMERQPREEIFYNIR